MTEGLRSFQQAKEQIKARIDLVAFVSESVPLKRAGRSFKGLCPFHDEKTPSFHVFPESQHFKCFGCQKGGDAFTFLMEREGIGFGEALGQLAERTGVRLPRGRGAGGGPDERQGFREVLSQAQAFFVERLAAPEGRAAREYLEGRGLEKARPLFGLGFAPGPPPGETWSRSGWPLARFLGQKSLDPELGIRLGLLGRTRDGQVFDRFRNRLMFPIQDERGGIVGFGGRILPGHESDREPKYLNSQESSLFNKRRVLFGLHQARKAGMRSLLVMEGYTDVLAAHLAGHPSAVATLGTSLTREHAALVRRFAPEGVHLLFDGDRAGRTAAERAYQALASETLPARICLLPEGSDPADLARARGGRGLQEVLDAGQEALRVWVDLLGRRLDLTSHEGKVAAGEACREILRVLGDPLRREDLAQRMASLLLLPPAHLRVEARRPPGPAAPARGTPRTPELKVQDTLLAALLKSPPAFQVLEDLWPGEEASLPSPRAREWIGILRETVLEEGEFPSAPGLLQAWMTHASGDCEATSWLLRLKDQADTLGDPEQALREGVEYLQKHLERRKLGQLREEIRRSLQGGDERKARELEIRFKKEWKNAAGGSPAPPP